MFLIRFLQGLAEHKDVHDSLLAACQYLKLSQNLTYPSAYLIPSKPMNRKYLASLVDNLAVREARVIGIDYLLDRPQGENDKILAKSLQKAVARQPNPTWFVFASVRDDGEGWLKVLPEIATPNWSLQGHINLSRGYVSLVSSSNSAGQKLPFAYLLALAYRLNLEGISSSSAPPNHPEKRGEKEVNLLAQERKGGYNRINPKLSSQSDFLSQITDYLRQKKGINYKTIFSPTAQRQPITNFSYG